MYVGWLRLTSIRKTKTKLILLDMAERKAVIKNADMSEEMQQDALDCATAALEKFNIEKVSVCPNRARV